MSYYTIFRKTRKVSIIWIILLVGFLVANSSLSLSASPRLRPRYYIVERGENLILISKRYGISVTELKKENGLTSDKIFPRQRLLIPWKGIWHKVGKGEYLELIAKVYGENNGIEPKSIEREIKQANGLYNPDKLKVGQKLFIPGAKKTLEIKIPRKKPSSPSGVWHTIKQPGETIYRIALVYGEAYGIERKEMQKKIMQHSNNKNIDSDNLQLAQKIFIPEAKKVLKIEIPCEILTKKETSGFTATAKTTETEREFKKEKPTLSWPADGEIVGYFDGIGNKGIDIIILGRETIVAPADGVVKLVEEIKELGRCLFIKHSKEGLISCFTNMPQSTAYLVKEGEEVKKEQPVAKIGASEAADTLSLHFEVRKIGGLDDPVNPLDYLP